MRAPGPPPPVNGYAVELLAPINGYAARDTTPIITFRPTSILGEPVTVDVEWRTTQPVFNSISSTWSPAPTYEQRLTGLSSGDEHTVQPPTSLAYSTWFYRLRAGDPFTASWGDWTPANRHVEVQPILGSAISYIALNVGVALGKTVNATAYIDMNIGRELVDIMEVVSYSDLNIGVQPKWRLVASYSDMNIYPVLGDYSPAMYSDLTVTTGTPSPVIWWIRPEQGREGYVFNIYGHGFGDFENQYDGEVRLGNYVCQISRWERVSEVPEVENIIKHGQGLEPDQITTEYGWIVAIVPSGAVSAMVKVVLEVGA